MDEKALAPLKTMVSNLETKAQEVAIETKEQYAGAADLIARLKETGSKVKNAKDSLVKPINEALRNARALFAPIEEQFANAESILKGKILSYKRKVDAEARKAEASIAKKVESGRMKLTTAETKTAAIERVDTTTKGSVGEVQIRKVKKVRIIDENAIPREYLEPNMVAIRRDALGGKQIAGIEVYEEETVAAGSL